jgi:diacylglycerol O-acyltransferase / wax synthase
VLDPVEQVYAVHASMKDTKALHETFGPELMHQWADLATPLLMTLGTRVYNRLKLADKHPPAANVIVSNVRGPDYPVSIAGTPIRRFYSVGPVLNGLGMNVTGWTYAGTLGLAVLADGEVVGDAHEMTEAIQRAFEELVTASGVLRATA